jgi:peroxiredoxin
MKEPLMKLSLQSVTLAFVFALSAVASAGVESGKPAPAFTLKDTNGKSHKLEDYKKKYVVLEWLNYECPFVKKHYNSKNMQKLQEEMKKKGVIWLSVVSSAEGKQGYYEPAEMRKLNKEKGGAPAAILYDTDGKVGQLYGAKTTPHMFVINPEGTLIYQGAIDDKASTDVEDIPGAKNYVKAAVDESMAKKPVSVANTKSYGCSVKYK